MSSTRSSCWRRAISAILAPKNPAWMAMTLSPGSARLVRPASMPLVPLALKHSDRPSGRRQSAFMPCHQIDQDVPEVGVEVSVHLQGHRLQDLRVDVRRSRAAQEASSGLQRRDAGHERSVMAGLPSRLEMRPGLNGRSKRAPSMAQVPSSSETGPRHKASWAQGIGRSAGVLQARGHPADRRLDQSFGPSSARSSRNRTCRNDSAST